MSGKTKRPQAVVVFALTLALLFLMSGCSALKSKKAPSAGNSAPVHTTKDDNAPLYYDFGDILLPRELKVDTSHSFVFRTPGLTAGVLSLKGRVEVNSLLTFFENKMPVDGWRQISSFKAPRSLMLFQKRTRWCVISITGGQINTVVEIWVAPNIGGSETGLQN